MMNVIHGRVGSAAVRVHADATTRTVVATRMYVAAVLNDCQDDAARERMRRLFHSPLGVYVSQATRDQDKLKLVFDVAVEDIEFTVRTLRQVLPDAEIESLRPRTFVHRKH